jgi:hypothetical protein
VENNATAGYEAELANELIMFCVCADPGPDDSIRCLHSDCSIMKPYASGPEAIHHLEMQRRVLRVGFEKLKSFVGLFTDWSAGSVL